MRKKGHLSLVETPVTPSNLELIEFGSIKSKPVKARHTVPQRLNDAERELSTMRDITGAAIFMMRTLPMEQLKVQELREMHEMFLNGDNLLNIYEIELNNLAGGRLSTQEARQFTKVRNIFKGLRASLPEAAAHVAGVLQKQSKNAGKSTSKSKGPKAKAKRIVAALNGIQLKVTLKGSSPPIWRRVLVPGDCSLAELHYTIQQSMGWSDDHLHRFSIRGKNFSDESADFADEEEYTLQDFNLRKGSKFEYEYDFGDSWIHTIEVEKILDEPHDVLECTDGRRACPPEDSGGLQGYYSMLEILKNPLHPEYQDVKEWIGEDFDPDGM